MIVVFVTFLLLHHNIPSLQAKLGVRIDIVSLYTVTYVVCMIDHVIQMT